MKLGKLIYLLSASLLIALPAVAKDKNKKHAERGHEVEVKPALGSVEVKTVVTKEQQRQPLAKVSITAAERESIQKYMASNVKATYTTPVVSSSKGLPPGLAKKAASGKPLPPGWQKKMTAGEVMPIEVYHQCQPLPKEISLKLPPQPKGVITVTVEGKVVRLLEATREILDVFDLLPH